jgi:glycosyltransferase involved in cell wall biosynthesis
MTVRMKGDGMRILMTSTHPGIRGPTPAIVEWLAAELRELGCQVDLSPWGQKCAHESRACKCVGRTWDLSRLVWRAARGRPDVLYVHTSHNWTTLGRDIPLLLLARSFARCVVLHLHGTRAHWFEDPRRPLFRLASSVLVSMASDILVLSTEELEGWTRLCPRTRFRVVVNPFIPLSERQHAASLPVRDAIPNGKDVMLFVGRLIREKGPFELLKALELVRRDRDCHILFVGDGPMRSSLVEGARQSGLTDAVTFTGYLTGPDLLAAYRSAKALVLPTWYEGFPTVVSEAMAEGLPIITTGIRGVRDQLTENVNALFVEPRNPTSVAGAIQRLLEDPELCKQMGRANRLKVQEFSPDSVVPRYFEILQESVKRGRKRDP